MSSTPLLPSEAPTEAPVEARNETTTDVPADAPIEASTEAPPDSGAVGNGAAISSAIDAHSLPADIPADPTETPSALHPRPPDAPNGHGSPSLSDSARPRTARTMKRQSHVVSFDKTLENILKLDTHDLNIQEDALIVIDKDKRKKSRRTCDFTLSSANNYRRVIPLYDILWAELSDDSRSLVIDFAECSSKTRTRAAKLTISLEPGGPDRPTPAEVAAWAELLRARAYGPVPQRRRAYVLVNPHAGPGGAVKTWQQQVRPLLDAARLRLTVVTTQRAGEAVELCQALKLDDYDMIIACSGDGLPHEVFNGLGKRPDARRALRSVAVAHVPCGSGNAMACNLYGTHRAAPAALAIVKGVVAPLDLVSITQGDKRILSFLSQAVGVVAEVDLGTEHLRWMGGARFTFGFLQRLLARKVYPCDLAVKVEIEHKEGVKTHYARQQSQQSSQQSSLQNSQQSGQQSGQQQDDAQKQRERAKLGSSTTTISEEDGNRSEEDAAAVASSSGGGEVGDNEDESLGLPPLKYGTINDKLPDGWDVIPEDKMGNFYCGNMAYMAPDANFFSAALMNDGLMDLVTVDGDISPAKSLAMLMSVEDGHFFDNPLVRYRKISGFRLAPKNQKDGYISIDGERIDFAPFQAEVHRGLGRVIAKRATGYEAPGPANWEKVSATERYMA